MGSAVMEPLLAQAVGGIQPGRRFPGVCACGRWHLASLNRAREPEDPARRTSCCVLRTGILPHCCDWGVTSQENRRGLSEGLGRGTHSQFPKCFCRLLPRGLWKQVEVTVSTFLQARGSPAG